MAGKKTTDFTPPGSGAEYTLVSETEILLSTPEKSGTLLEYFNFSVTTPSIRLVRDSGAAKTELGTVAMEKVPGDMLRHLSQAYMALRELGGDPFLLQKALAAGKTGKMFGR